MRKILIFVTSVILSTSAILFYLSIFNVELFNIIMHRPESEFDSVSDLSAILEEDSKLKATLSTDEYFKHIQTFISEGNKKYIAALTEIINSDEYNEASKTIAKDSLKLKREQVETETLIKNKVNQLKSVENICYISNNEVCLIIKTNTALSEADLNEIDKIAKEISNFEIVHIEILEN